MKKNYSKKNYVSVISIKETGEHEKSLEQQIKELHLMNMTRGLTLSTEKCTVMANKFVWAKHKFMTLQEARLFRILITQAEKNDEGLFIYICKAKELAKMIGVSSQNMYRDLQKICGKLTEKNIAFATNNPKDPWRYIPITCIADYNGDGTITVGLNEMLAPYFLGLGEHYTQYQLKHILKFGSFYTIRIYELIKSELFRENLEISFKLDKLKEILDCEKKFRDYRNFRKWVLEPAFKDINENSNLVIRSWEPVADGRKTIGIKLRAYEISK